MTRIHPNHRRGAFTIVEMLVASALIMFMMWIIAAAFQAGLESFRVLKTAGDMQEKLRSVATALRRDLTRPHFEATSSQPWGGQDLSNQRMDQPTAWQPPTQGYFRIFSAGIRIVDGRDPDDPNLSVHYRVADSVQQGDVLQFTIKLRGLRRDQMFLIDANDPGRDPLTPYQTATPPWGLLHRFSFPLHTARLAQPFAIPPSVDNSGSYNPNAGTSAEPPPTYFTTQWADVTYFLRPNNSFAGTQPLFSLYRRQNLLVSKPADGNEPNLPERVAYSSGTSPRPLELFPNDSHYYEVSSWQSPSAPTGDGSLRANFPNMITAPCRRFGVDQRNAAGIYSTNSYLGQIPRFVDQLGDLASTSNPLTGTDLILTDVTDFAVKLLWEPTPAVAPFGAVNGPQPVDPVTSWGNPDFPFDILPQGNNPSFTGTQRIFDTWSQRVPPAVVGTFDDYSTWNTAGSAKTIPLKIRVRAIQIQLRIWDVKSQQSRQITIIQDV